MASDLQRLVESLGRRLSRSVAIDDPSIRLLAHSSHAAEVDDARVESIMRREVPAELVRHIQESGLFEATDLFTLPASPELGMSIVRIGMPIRDDRAVIGILWLLTSDGEVSEDEAQAVREAAEAASRLMHREHLLGELSRGRKRELMRDLISAEPRLCREASERLIDEELVTTGPVTTLSGTRATSTSRASSASCTAATSRSSSLRWTTATTSPCRAPRSPSGPATRCSARSGPRSPVR